MKTSVEVINVSTEESNVNPGDLEGKQAPDFELPATTGENIRLSDYQGQNVILYFYPKDNTPGCTTEACDFRDALPELNDKNVKVLGVSPDSMKKHENFTAKHELSFPLLSDEEQEAANAYGVWKWKKNFGKEYLGIVRSTFFIDTEGVVQKVWDEVKVKDHIGEVSRYVDEFLSSSKK
ncbi:thioredoxin-dependent thiol peroxidase [uncultured Marinococcus sp.]|jgi:peroxiredoxin Q/BCP|uniref:thioredoxin-dependent thiol peroxidase n=1 Tax=uncultured Marinococcus sp. TaxID=487012 RepID=UPI00263053C5|nr:thioredoxin-dependent thiol peroxidase [uncultured Marinococcus sp.]